MGNSISSNNFNQETNKLKNISFGQIIDYIATKYILTMDFKNLNKLYEKDYCDNLVVLTSDIVERYFTDLEISYLSQRIKNGVEENIMDKDKLIVFSKQDVDKFNIKVPLKKKRVCIGIAKFYVKIAHIFAAIVMTINPIYVYKDTDGNIVKKGLYEKNTIPKNVEKKIYKLGICNSRINALKREQNFNQMNEETFINPKMCSINLNSFGDVKTLQDEPGINELMDLYYDKYDFKSGQFIGMTDETSKIFKNDLLKFYQVFTGKETMPENIQKFSDIKLKDFNNDPNCKGTNNIYSKNYKNIGSTPEQTKEINNLFIQYADNLKQMMKGTNKSQENLLEIINDLFSYVIDKQTKKKVIRVNPMLTEQKLDELIQKTRNIIINLYLKCETDYLLGIKIYQAIVENKIKDTAINQIKVLQGVSEELINNK